MSNLKKYFCIKDTDSTRFIYKFNHNNFYYGYLLEDVDLGNSIVMICENGILKFSLEKNHCIFNYLNEYFIDLTETRKRKLLKLKSPD